MNQQQLGTPCNDFTTWADADTTGTFGSLSSATAKQNGGVLAPRGMIYRIPRDSATVFYPYRDITRPTAVHSRAR